MKLPPLPKRIPSPLGPVKIVVTTPILSSKNDLCNGLWDHDARTISIDRTLESPVAWHTLFHELVHVAFTDSGIDNLLTEQMAESVCDTVASLLTSGMRAGTFSYPNNARKRRKRDTHRP